jgi:hypothetical protein
MFTPRHLLPQYNLKVSEKYRDRWDTKEGEQILKEIFERIRKDGGGKYLLVGILDKYPSFLEDEYDLKGIKFINEDIDFPCIDNFKVINFSYSSFYHSKFKNACFYVTHFTFSTIYNCQFENCIFSFGGFFGSTLEKVNFINCEFIDEFRITNCNFKTVEFQNCFFTSNIFSDCKFDETTIIYDPMEKSIRTSQGNTELDKREIAGIFKGIREGYIAGDVIEKERNYFFKERQAVTRYNTKGRWKKLTSYFLEMVAGYGIKPLRVLVALIISFIIFSAIFMMELGFSEGILLSAGAFFTFGANSHLLSTLSPFFKIFYIMESFLGISLMAMFITVLANYWFRWR